MTENVITILVGPVPDGFDVNPTRTNVPAGDTELNWRAGGGSTFPTSGFFSWKTGSGQPTVTRESERHLKATYTNSVSTPTVWQYSISLVSASGTVTIDPEVNNEPPVPAGG